MRDVYKVCLLRKFSPIVEQLRTSQLQIINTSAPKSRTRRRLDVEMPSFNLEISPAANLISDPKNVTQIPIPQ